MKQGGRAALLLLAAVLMTGAAEASGEESDLETLRKWMTGSFSSHAQVQADSSYYDIRLEMVPIWKSRSDGAWLYVEPDRIVSWDRGFDESGSQVWGATAGGYVFLRTKTSAKRD